MGPAEDTGVAAVGPNGQMGRRSLHGWVLESIQFGLWWSWQEHMRVHMRRVVILIGVERAISTLDRWGECTRVSYLWNMASYSWVCSQKLANGGGNEEAGHRSLSVLGN